jgi:hypothetical protein
MDVQYDKFLYAFDGDLKSIDGSRLVWSSADAEVCDYDEAIKSLKALKIPPQKLGDISTMIDNLSVEAARDDIETFRGNSTPPSEPPEPSTSGGPSRGRRRGQRDTGR